MNYTTQVIGHLKGLIKRDIDSLIKELGEAPGQERVSPEAQMKLYEGLTEADITALEEKRGAANVGAYILEMEKRKRRRRS